MRANVLLATTTTDANGFYLFPNVAPGTYFVVVDTASCPPASPPIPPTTRTTAPSAPTTAPSSPSPPARNTSPPTSATTGRNLVALGAIGDRIWVDANGDGVQDAGEPGLPGVPVQLYYDSNNDGTVDALYGSTTSDPNGSYIFDNLPPGAYQVVVNTGFTPTGYTQTGDPDATLDNRTTSPLVLAPGDVFVNADFGYRPHPELHHRRYRLPATPTATPPRTPPSQASQASPSP